MMLLPILVICLIVIGVYLSFQKSMSNMNKIIIAILAVIIFNIAYTYLKKTTEGFTVDDASNNSYDIEVASPDYDENSENTNTEKETYNDTPSITRRPGIKEVVDSINYDSRIDDLQDAVAAEEAASVNEKFGDIKQSDVKGTGNIFNPQVIVRNSDGGQSISYSPDGGDTSVPIYSGAPSWQTPVADLWDMANASAESYKVQKTTGGGKCVYKDPMSYITQNISHSYDVADNNKRKCGEYPAPPESEGDVEYPYASKTKSKDKSKVYYPGYSFAPPSSWDVPQKRPPPCIPDKTRLCPMGVFDRGTPTNVLELTADGNQCSSENECELTNIGSIMPKFEFKEIYDY
jgi:hypothetical protein